MALSAVANLLGKLSSPAIDEMKLLGGVEIEVNEIKAELEFMKSFLQDADARGETDEWLKTLVKQVRDVAYDAEDILDEYYLHLIRPCNQGIFSSFLNCLDYFKQLITRHLLATKMQDIKRRITSISKKSKDYAFNVIVEGGTRVHTTSVQWHDPRIESLYMDEAEVVGIEVPKNKLIRWLTEGELELTMISVVGMGGLGKTTLVKKVYDSQMVNQHFDCRVWITISHSPMSTKELLRTTIKEVLKATKEQAPKGMDAMDVNELIQELSNQLSEKRYVIIFDDIWDINVWKAMKFAFCNHDCGSRIIFTTRIHEVAKYTNYSHSLEPLSNQEAWRLFCMKAFRSNHESISCPEELEELSRNILKKCNGLPLAIVLIGGSLANKAKTVWEWKNVHDSVGGEMRNAYNLESLNRILLLSYNSLPYYLKPCFLYLSMFPEDHLISRMKLIRLWIAEGFVEEEKQGVTMEVVAGNYINELISRSMIQIAELNSSDEVTSCKIHDLMRETILLKSKEECFSTTINISGSQEGIGLHENQARRISIYHNNKSTGDEKKYNSYLMGSRCSHIRSLTMFQLDDESPTRSFIGDKFFCAFRLLRVLDLAGADLVKFPPELVELIHLRYLSLRSCRKITVLPKSVGKLKNLETLDLKQTGVSELPVEILKLQRLRHLLVYRRDEDLVPITLEHIYGVSVPTGIGNLISLQKLAFLDVQHQVARDGCRVLKELGKLTQLRRLGITNLRSKYGRDLCLSLQKMEHLSTLQIEARSTRKKDDVNEDEEKEFLELEPLMSSPPQLLSRLILDGRLVRLPVWIASLRNLTYLGLGSSRLSCEEEDPLKAFRHMPNLIRLDLIQAYDGEELCCSEIGGYKNLKRLFLLKMEGLKRVRFMKGSMPMLRELKIWNCPALEMVPRGIEHLSGLQELSLIGLHPGLVERIRKTQPRSLGEAQGGGEDALVERIRKTQPRSLGEAQGGGEDCWRVQHIPKYYHVFRNTEGTFVYDQLQ